MSLFERPKYYDILQRETEKHINSYVSESQSFIKESL